MQKQLAGLKIQVIRVIHLAIPWREVLLKLISRHECSPISHLMARFWAALEEVYPESRQALLDAQNDECIELPAKITSIAGPA